jgi:2-oxo-4-hydroxy-4-carboxy-5-ureidoimidazoline decarboxylase
VRVDEAPLDEARALLRTCCGSSRWVEHMVRRRPFGTHEAMIAASREVWFSLTPDDWQEAFADHPRIGDRDALKKKFAETRHLASREQAGVAGAADDVLDALARGNREYERRFGYIFIVCATGLDAGQMLARLNARLVNDPSTELQIAAQEQSRIIEIRLKRL